MNDRILKEATEFMVQRLLGELELSLYDVDYEATYKLIDEGFSEDEAYNRAKEITAKVEKSFKEKLKS